MTGYIFLGLFTVECAVCKWYFMPPEGWHRPRRNPKK